MSSCRCLSTPMFWYTFVSCTIRMVAVSCVLRCIVVFDTARFAICVFHFCSTTLDACSCCCQYTAIPLNLLGFAGFPITTSYAFVGVRIRYLEFRCTDNSQRVLVSLLSYYLPFTFQCKFALVVSQPGVLCFGFVHCIWTCVRCIWTYVTVEFLFVVLMIVPVVEVDICCDYFTCFNWYRRFFFLVCINPAEV